MRLRRLRQRGARIQWKRTTSLGNPRSPRQQLTPEKNMSSANQLRRWAVLSPFWGLSPCPWLLVQHMVIAEQGRHGAMSKPPQAEAPPCRRTHFGFFSLSRRHVLVAALCFGGSPSVCVARSCTCDRVAPISHACAAQQTAGGTLLGAVVMLAIAFQFLDRGPPRAELGRIKQHGCRSLRVAAVSTNRDW